MKPRYSDLDNDLAEMLYEEDREEYTRNIWEYLNDADLKEIKHIISYCDSAFLHECHNNR